LIRESFEKQPVRTVTEACERTLSTQRSGTGIGDAVRNHVVVPAVVFAETPRPTPPGQDCPNSGGPAGHRPGASLRSAPATQAAFPTTICDKSRWRSARSLYSPNLNLIERLWKFIKRRALYGRYQPTFAQFQAAIQEVLDGLSTTHAEKLKSLMTLKFQRFEDVSLMAA